MRLNLDTGDEVACTTVFRDFVVVVTKRGAVYRLTYNIVSDNFQYERV
jgi:hypothetical protein